MRRLRATKPSVVVAAAMVALTVASAAVGVAQESQAAVAAAPTLLWEDNFADPAAVDRWQKDTGRIGAKGKSQAHFLAANVFPENGALVVRSRRHCAKEGEPLTDANAREAPCGNPKNTRYSSGRLNRDAGILAGNFKVEFTATLPKAEPGTRSALWMKNPAKYCTDEEATNLPTNLGELDALEWHGAHDWREKTTATTHMSCHSKENTDTWQSPHHRSGAREGTKHTWTVERRGNKIKYWIDDTRVGTDVCGKRELKAIGQKQCDQILDQPWSLRMQGEVFGNGHSEGRYAPPDDKKHFSEQRFLIHSVRVYQLPAGDETTDPDSFDLQATGGNGSGATGSTVRVKVATRNHGPAAGGARTTVTAPEGTELVATPENCTVTADKKVASCDGAIPAGTDSDATFSFKINGPVTKDGTVLVSGVDPDDIVADSIDETRPENNVAPIKITVVDGEAPGAPSTPATPSTPVAPTTPVNVGAPGGGGDELAHTGASVGLSVGLGALLLATGAVLMVLARRRRLFSGEHRPDQ